MEPFISYTDRDKYGKITVPETKSGKAQRENDIRKGVVLLKWRVERH